MNEEDGMTTQSVVPAGGGTDHDWAKDHVFVKTPFESTDGRVTVVEDILKPGFNLARHHHRVMVEIFYILEGVVTFAFDDGSVDATPGMTVNVPPGVWHVVSCPAGGRLITVFTPGGFDHYLAELAALDQSQLADEHLMARLGEQYDIWTA
jgi:mannose-6-phosphate isomerase-like protein (cupin superfamily)